MIEPRDRVLDAGALALELERLGGRLMMMFVAGRDGDTRKLRAVVHSDDAVIVLRAPVDGNAYPAVTPSVPAA